MNPTDFMRGAVDALGWAANEVTLYPVRASEVTAYLGAGLSGTTAKGVVNVQRFVAEDGNVGVATHIIYFKTDAQTAAQVTVRRSSLAYDDRLYDVVGIGPMRPGDVDLYLQEYQ